MTEEGAQAAARQSLRDGQRRRRRLSREWLAVAAGLVALAAALALGHWTWRLDQTLHDAGLALLERPDNGRIVIVAVDEESLAALGRWPWPRRTHAALLERIASAAPASLGVDVAYIEPDAGDAEGDRLLARALARVPAAALPVILDGETERAPIAELRAAARLGHVGALLDADGVLRSVDLERSVAGGAKREHLALAMLRAAGLQPRNAGLPPRLNLAFAGPPGHFRRVSAAAVLSGAVAPAELRGRHVLVGATAGGLGDRFATPSTVRGGPMPGVEVVANVLDALLTGREVRRASSGLVAAVSALVVLVLLALFLRATPRTALWSALGISLGAPLAAFALLGGAHFWFPPATLALVALVSYPLWSWRRLEAASSYLDEELSRLRSESPGDRRDPRQAGSGDFLGRRIDAVSDAVGMLRSARRLVVDSLEGLPHAALVAGLDGRVAIANRLAGTLGAQPTGGRPLHEVLGALVPADGAAWPALLEAAREGPVASIETAAADGRAFLVRIGPFRDGEGEPAGLIAIAEDVTALRRAQQEREETLAFVSHDLRSPQASIIALAELQRIDETRQAEEAFVAKVEQLAWKTVALAEDFVHLTRADSRPLARAAFDLGAVAQACAEEIAPQAEGRGTAIACEGGERCVVDADRALVARALTNLMSNAIKYGGERSRVTVSVERVGAEVRCAIADQGVGMTAAERERLFRHFERIESVSRATRAKGIGLGLVFVETVARRHGGRVSVESEPGKGSRFSLWLPAAQELPAEHAGQ